MDSAEPQPIIETAVEDTGCLCARCDYNLTGLSFNRCPECGLAFDLTKFPKYRYPRAAFILITLQGCATILVLLLSILFLNDVFGHQKRLEPIVGLLAIVIQIPLAMIGWIFGGFACAADGYKRLWWTFSIIAFALTATNMVIVQAAGSANR